jgi:hypothetical protein
VRQTVRITWKIDPVAEQSGMLELSITVGGSSFSASGETSVVLDAYADFKEFVRSVSTAPAPEPLPASEEVVQADEGSAPEASGPQAIKAPTSLPLKPYLDRLKLRGNKEKATAIIAWSGESGEKASLTVEEVEKLWKNTSFKVPKNLARDIGKAESEGWLDSQGKRGSRTHSISGYGEGIVAGWDKSSAK